MSLRLGLNNPPRLRLKICSWLCMLKLGNLHSLEPRTGKGSRPTCLSEQAQLGTRWKYRAHLSGACQEQLIPLTLPPFRVSPHFQSANRCTNVFWSVVRTKGARHVWLSVRRTSLDKRETSLRHDTGIFRSISLNTKQLSLSPSLLWGDGTSRNEVSLYKFSGTPGPLDE